MLDYQRVKHWSFPPEVQRYTRRDVILYALGIGAGQQDPLADSELQFVHEPRLVTMPTFAVTLGSQGLWTMFMDKSAGIDWRMALHGDQMLRVHAPMPPEGEMLCRWRVDEVYDKGEGRGAVLYATNEIRDAATGRLLAEATLASFLRGNGGFGGRAEGAPKPQALPQRALDIAMEIPTRPDQALLYRLSGDLNPLHIDPAAARVAGLERPILHGLCAYGIAARAAIRTLCGDDATRLQVLNLRFAQPVLPGETLRFEFWRGTEGNASFRATVVERDAIVLNNGYIEYG